MLDQELPQLPHWAVDVLGPGQGQGPHLFRVENMRWMHPLEGLGPTAQLPEEDPKRVDLCEERLGLG